MLQGLRDGNDVFAERMCNPGFVHHVRVLVGEVRHDDFSSVDQIKNILKYRTVVQMSSARLDSSPTDVHAVLIAA